MQSASRSSSYQVRPGASPMPRPQSQQVNNQTKVIDSEHGRILCIADIRGRLSNINDMVREAGAKAVIHTGDFGFLEASSLERTSDRILKHLTQYSPLIPEPHRESLLAPNTAPSVIRSAVNIQFLSEFPLLLTGQIKFNVPVFTVWGTCEDVVVLEKFRLGTYDIENLHVIDEATTRCLDIGGIKLRILGLGGAFVPHKMFDNGEGSATIAGGQGTMWTTALQIGELVDTAQRVFDNSETRLLLTHASPGREGIITQLALVLKADLTISAGLHFRHSSSWNEFSVQGDFDGFRHKIISGKESIDKIWECVRPQVEAVVDDNQRILLDKALHVVSRVPPQQPHIGPGGNATEEQAWKHCWNWNLCDVYNGSLVLDIKEGRISAELKSQGFNYSYRRSGTTAATPNSATSALPNANAPPSSTATPGPPKAQPPPKSNGVSTSASPPPQAAKPQAQQPSAPVSGKDTPKDTKLANGGAGSVASPVDKSSEADKFKNRKEKFKKDKRDGKDRETDGDRPDTPAGSERATPAAADSTDGGSNPMSPVGGENRSRAQTPTGRKPPLRSPWTLHMKAPAEVKESDVREFFGEAQSGIIKINIPNNAFKKALVSVFIIFKDEDAMKLGQEKHQEKIMDHSPSISVAEPNPQRVNNFRGHGRGAGAFAARGMAAAGLIRNFGDRRGAEPVKDS